MREPAYKHVLQARDIHLEEFKRGDSSVVYGIKGELSARGYDMDVVSSYLDSDKVRMIALRDGNLENTAVAVAAASRLDSIDLLSVFGDQDIAAYIRSRAAGSIAVIGGLYFSQRSSIANLPQIILVELLSQLLAKDYTYVVYHPCDEAGLSPDMLKAVEKQGFINIAPKREQGLYSPSICAHL